MTLRLFLCRPGPLDDARLPHLLARLDDAERARAARFTAPRARWLYAAAHALLRHALDHQAEPRPWRFRPDSHGKPHLHPPYADLRFSLSHTEGLVAVALATGYDVGVDVEPTARPISEPIETLVLAPAERDAMHAAADPTAHLLQLWVAKEAIAKALGRGLGLAFPAIVLLGDPLALHALPPGCGTPAQWHLHTARAGAHYLAVAAAHPFDLTQTEVGLDTLLAPNPPAP